MRRLLSTRPDPSSYPRWLGALLTTTVLCACGDAGVVVAERSTPGESNPAPGATLVDEPRDNPMDAFRDLPGMPFDAQDVAHGFVVVDNSESEQALEGHQVRVTLSETALAELGIGAGSCDALRIYSADGCFRELDHWVESCDDDYIAFWVRVPEVSAGGREVLMFAWDGAESASDGGRTFEFFEDFEGDALDTTRWNEYGDGSLIVADGIARADGVKLLATKDFLVRHGIHVLGARLRASSRHETDVELGVSLLNTIPVDSFWVSARDWDGVLFSSWNHGGLKISGVDSSSCPGTIAWDDLGDRWVDETPDTADFLTAEFRYLNRDTHTQAWLSTSRGETLSHVTDQDCYVPDLAPVHITLDHMVDEFNPTQEVDYVYVRKFASPEPSTQLMKDPPPDGSLRCDPR